MGDKYLIKHGSYVWIYGGKNIDFATAKHGYVPVNAVVELVEVLYKDNGTIVSYDGEEYTIPYIDVTNNEYFEKIIDHIGLMKKAVYGSTKDMPNK